MTMKRKLIFPTLGLLAAVVLSGIGFTANAQSFASTTASTIGSGDQLVTEFEVNGLKVLVKRRPASQSVVAGLFIRGGAANLTKQNAGIESIMLDAATESSAKYPLADMRRELSRTGSTLGFGVNLDYSVLSLGSTKRYFGRSWDVFVDAALHPTFTQADLTRVKSRALASLESERDTPDSYLQDLQSEGAYTGHPYLNDPHGTVSSVRAITVEDVRAYHRQAMQTSRLLLVIVGDVDPLDIKKKVELSFGALPKGTYVPKTIAPLSFAAPTLAVTRQALPTNYVQGVFTAPAMTSPDIYAMRVATSILAERVYSEVRVRRNLSYAPDAFLRSQAANIGGIYVTAVDANQSIDVMLREIKRLQNDDIEQSAIQDTAQQFLTKYYLGQETNAAQAGELAQFEIIGGGWRNAALFIDRMRTVTPADVRRVANQYMKNIQFVVIGDPAAIDRSVFLPAS